MTSAKVSEMNETVDSYRLYKNAQHDYSLEKDNSLKKTFD